LTLRTISFLILILLSTKSWAGVTTGDVPAWSNQNIFHGSGLDGITAKNPIPEFVGMNSAVDKFTINGGWKNTGITADQGKMIKFDWNINNIVVHPRKYLVLFRLDYRFDLQPMLIYFYDYQTNSYKNDYSNYQGVDLSVPPINIFDNLARIALLNQYASMTKRGISLQSGDILNIVFVDDFTALDKNFADIGTLTANNPVKDMSLYELNSRLPAAMQNNVILNMSADDLCRYTPNLSNFSQVCILQPDTNLYAYKPVISIKDVVGGMLSLPAAIPKCDASQPADYWNLLTIALDYIIANYTKNSTKTTFDRWLNAADNHLRNYLKKGGDFNALYQNKANLPEALKSWSKDNYRYLYKWLMQDKSCVKDAVATKVNYCLQDNGLGLQIAIGSSVIKKDVAQFIPVVDSSTNYVYTVKAASSGQLMMSVNPKFNNGSTNSFLNFEPKLSITDPKGTGDSYVNGLSMTGLQFGRYLMQISIGSDASSTGSVISNLSYEYYIQSSGDPNPIDSTSGSSMSLGNSKFDAPSSGAIWVRVKNNSSDVNLNGDVNIKTTSYTGSQVISKGINDYIIKPVLKRYASAMRSIYDGPTGLVRNANIKNIVNTMAALYIIIYAIYFLLGAVEMTASDLLSRIIKVILVVNILFSENSWQFFNDYLFSMMFQGTNQLISIFTNSSSSVSNPFSFLDPVFNTYISSAFWLAILVQLVQIWNGLGLLALLVITSVTLFFATLLEIVMTYILSLIIIYILVGLAPIFIPLMLFTPTKSFFTNWISVIFKNMLQPAIFIALILIFDQFMSGVLESTVVANSWGCLQDFEISFSLAGMNIDLIPANSGFCLPFFIPDIDFHFPPSKIHETLSNLGDASAKTLLGSILSYVNVAMASFLYFTYTIVAKQLLGFTGDILANITGILGDNAVRSTVGNIKQNSMVGKAFAKFSGNEIMNRYVARRSPVSYQDNINKKAGNIAKKSWNVTSAVVKGSGKMLYKGGKATAGGLYLAATDPKQACKNVGSAIKKAPGKAWKATKKTGYNIVAAPFRLIGDSAKLVGKDSYDTIAKSYKGVKKIGKSAKNLVTKKSDNKESDGE
jgi:type IV secretory pathway VirB6-like protein